MNFNFVTLTADKIWAKCQILLIMDCIENCYEIREMFESISASEYMACFHCQIIRIISSNGENVNLVRSMRRTATLGGTHSSERGSRLCKCLQHSLKVLARLQCLECLVVCYSLSNNSFVMSPPLMPLTCRSFSSFSSET